MPENRAHILVVDDDDINQAIIKHYLADFNYQISVASSGEEAMTILRKPASRFDLVLLDKFMGGMDGIEVLQQIKADPHLKILPVILQTADDRPEHILEGIRAGAYYYLTKPLSYEQLHLVVDNALQQHFATKIAHDELSQIKDSLELVQKISLSFKTREQARDIIKLLSKLCSLSAIQGMGLLELLLNAIEHGNLAISYHEKTQLIKDNLLNSEINHRLNLPEYADKIATIEFKRSQNQYTFTITDQGKGFDWLPYMDMHIERINDNHGRGIAMVNKMAFSHLNYLGCGNTVEAIIPID